MAAVGGSVQELTIRGRIFAVAADADVGRDLGGFSVSIESNGNGTVRILKTRKPWMLDGLKVEINDTQGDQAFLKEITDGNEEVVITATFADGSTFQGKGLPLEEVKRSSASATADIKLGGGGELSQQ